MLALAAMSEAISQLHRGPTRMAPARKRGCAALSYRLRVHPLRRAAEHLGRVARGLREQRQGFLRGMARLFEVHLIE